VGTIEHDRGLIMPKKSILLAENLAYEIKASRTLFQGVNLSIEEGDRIALVGSNGTGKSTLLKFKLSQQAIQMTRYLPKESEQYYQELLNDS
jgi:ATPase subunit of ABC transporter with duplicated ATPase domains